MTIFFLKIYFYEWKYTILQNYRKIGGGSITLFYNLYIFHIFIGIHSNIYRSITRKWIKDFQDGSIFFLFIASHVLYILY